MHIGKWVLLKYNGKIVKGIVTHFSQEDLEIEIEDKSIIQRKFWEVRAAPFDNIKEEL